MLSFQRFHLHFQTSIVVCSGHPVSQRVSPNFLEGGLGEGDVLLSLLLFSKTSQVFSGQQSRP